MLHLRFAAHPQPIERIGLRLIRRLAGRLTRRLIARFTQRLELRPLIGPQFNQVAHGGFHLRPHLVLFGRQHQAGADRGETGIEEGHPIFRRKARPIGTLIVTGAVGAARLGCVVGRRRGTRWRRGLLRAGVDRHQGEGANGQGENDLLGGGRCAEELRHEPVSFQGLVGEG